MRLTDWVATMIRTDLEKYDENGNACIENSFIWADDNSAKAFMFDSMICEYPAYEWRLETVYTDKDGKLVEIFVGHECEE